MNNESGVSVKKPVPAFKKSIAVNFKDFSQALGKAGVDIAFGKWDSLAADGVDALGALGLAAGAAGIAKFIFYVFLVLFVLVILAGVMGFKAFSNNN